MTSVVILNWNGVNYLRRFLPALIEHTTHPEVEIVVADNASVDDSLHFLHTEYPKIKTIGLDKNYGFAGGYNKALKQLKSEYYVLLNSDVEVTPGWLDTLSEQMKAHPEIAACQPKIRSYDRKGCFEHAGASGGFIDRYGYPFCRGRIFDTTEEDRGQYDDKTEVFWATGACLMIRADKFWEVDGFDEAFFAHMEEIDLCWRLQNKGYKIFCFPESCVYHVGGGTLDAGNSYKTFLNFRNNLLMLYKNLHGTTRTKTLSVRHVFDMTVVFRNLLKGDVQNAKAVLSARREYKKMRKLYDVDPKSARPSTVLTKNIYPKSIVKAYYLQNKKTFASLIPNR
ncbi:MAG: glycosyltransferase family 2 protein [Prevotellaceae bacterium]|jgi:GT2 family glycosyltransferase|nr:glycosyltransferase family 2 protein [Prevotellaceae bacterium]